MQEYKLFNDIFFDKAKRYVKNEITQDEVDLLSLGKIRKVYGSFEELLFDNIEYYSRIIRTILWLYENTLVHNGKVIMKMDKVKYKIPMTPTKFYYICLPQIDFTRDELLYGYPQISYTQGNTFKDLWKDLIKVGSFAFNVSFSTEQAQTKSYQHALERDITNPDYLNKVIVSSKFVYIDRMILSEDIMNVIHINEIVSDNYLELESKHLSNTIIDSRPNGISYIGGYFSNEVKFNTNSIVRTQTGDIEHTMEYDMFLSSKLPTIFNNIKKIQSQRSNLNNLKLICISMITNYRTKFKALRLSNTPNTHSYITLKKFWNNYRVIECSFSNGKLLHKKIFNLGKIHKVANYLIDNGYFIYTIGRLEDSINVARLDDPGLILDHFTEYINKTFVDSTLRLELMENETNKIVQHLTRFNLIDEQ